MSDFRLARVTFTGVDERTDTGALKVICVSEPRVEFAVQDARTLIRTALVLGDAEKAEAAE